MSFDISAWATDRIEENGIIGFVTNGQFIDASTLCGLRKSLVSEFNSIYCFNLRGDQRTQGELSRKEGGKIFGSGSRTPVAITIRNIPTKAYDYIVNGKSAIEWIVEQYAVTTDKASGIVNDPNTYAGGKYIFDLLLSIISVSLKTQELIAQLPEYKEI